jgi:hypothetical protein
MVLFQKAAWYSQILAGRSKLSNVTTVTVDKDTWLNGNNQTQNKGTDRSQSIGAYYVLGSFYKYNGIFSFDVSGITDPSTITSATLTLPYSRSTGTTTQTVTLARLNQDFVENEATYLISETAVSWSGGSGGFGNAETTQPTYTFDVGSGVSADVTIDIKDLVVDAIVKRSGTLLLIASVVGTPTGSASGYTAFVTQDAPASNGASIAITQAERIVWSGATNGNMSTDSNWVGGTKPDANDFAMFIENGTNNPTLGAVICERIYIGKLFSQDAGVEGASLALQATSVFVDTQAQLYTLCNATELIIRNTKDTIDGCNIRGTITNLYITNCNSTITVDTLAVISNIYIMSGNRINPTTNTSTGIVSQVIIEDGSDDSNILCEGRFNVTDNGENDDISLYGGGKYELNNTSEVDGIENLTIASGSVCYFNAKEIQTALTMYGGTFTIEKNTNAQLDMPTTIDLFASDFNLYNGLDSANATAFSGTTFTSYSGRIAMGQSAKITLTG